MIASAIRILRLPQADLITALIVSGTTGGFVLLQRIVVFDALEGLDENRFAQLMALWAVISILLGRIQHRAMAGVAEQQEHRADVGQKRLPVERISLTVGCLIGLGAWAASDDLLSLGLSSLCYAASLPVLLGLIGRAYGYGSATAAQAASLLIAGIQLMAAWALIVLTDTTLEQVAATLATSTLLGTSLLWFWWRNHPPINWTLVLTPVRHLLLGSVALASSWAACQADVFALALVPNGSRFAEYGAAVYLGKTGLYAAIPIIPILAKQSYSGQLTKSWKLLLATCLGSAGVAAAVIIGLTILGTVRLSLIGPESQILMLIALTQAPGVIILIFSYSIAMSREATLAAALGPVISLIASAALIRILSGNPAICLIIAGLSQALLALFLARVALQQNAGPSKDHLRPPIQPATTSMIQKDLE